MAQSDDREDRTQPCHEALGVGGHELSHLLQTLLCGSDHAQVTQEPIPFGWLREITKMLICSVEDTGLSQDTDQEPGSSDQQQK